jgi:hypothetical protein
MPSIYARLGGHDAVKLTSSGCSSGWSPILARAVLRRYGIERHRRHVRPFIAAARAERPDATLC